VPESSPWFGKTVTVNELRWYNQSPVIFLKDVDDRNAAESLIKAILLVDTDVSALPVEPDAWYDHQLVGLKVLRDGKQVGEVIRVDHLPAQDLLAVETASGEVLVPFVKAFVPEVDIKAGTLTVTPPGGLFESLDDDTPGGEKGIPAEIEGLTEVVEED
jgi:16S rRNA processing protein RimM